MKITAPHRIVILCTIIVCLFLISCAGASTQYYLGNYTPNNKLLLHNNGTSGGSVFIDEAGHTVTNHGSPTTNTATKYLGNASGYFDGSSYISVPGSGNFAPQLTDNFTLSFWYKRNSTARMWACGQSDSVTTASTRQLEFEFLADGKVLFDVQNGGSFDQLTTTSTYTDTTNWHQFVVIGNATTIALYHDGVLQSPTVSRTINAQVSTYPFSVGHLGDYSGGYFFNGYIDEFAYWQGAATPLSISELYPQTAEIETAIAPVATFTANVTGGIEPLPVQFNETSASSGTSWIWNATNKTGNNVPFTFSTIQNATYTFPSGNYTIQLISTNAGGSNISTQITWVNVTPSSMPIANFTYSPQSGPTPLTVSFTDTSITNITAWNWTFGAANYSSLQNPSYTFVGAGNYSVTLQVTNASGTNSTTKYVLVNSLPDPNLNSTLEYAVTATPQINNQSPITGTIKLSEVDTNTTWVKVNATWDTTYFGVSDIRVNTSDISGTSLTSSEIHNGYFIANISKSAGMDFAAPGKSLIDFNITMTKYAAPGTAAAFNFTSVNSQYYDIGNSTAWNFNHLSGMTAYAGTWGPITAAFTGSPTLVSIGSAVSFTDASTGYPDAWSWTFGDGETSTAQNPSHAYSTAGLYSVTETAYMVENATVTNTTTRTNYINVSSSTTPVAAFTGSPTTVTLGTAVTFTDQSTGSPTSWTWNFGDSSGSANQNPTHTYSSVGTYNVTLTAANWIGNSTLTKTNYITVLALAPPVANFTSNVSSGQIPLAVQFTDTSTNVPTSWSWNFGDGGTSTSQNPEHTFSTAGNWTANLTATNAAGSNTTTRYILATSPSGFNRQDLYMSPEYVLTLTIKDTDGNVIPVVTVSDSDGNIANTTNGVYIHTYPYEAVAIYLSSDGYQSRSITYVMNRDRVETVQMTAATPQSQNTNIIYTQQQVRFIVMNSEGTKVNGAVISASVVNSTLPSDSLTILEQAFGINSNVAEIMLNGSEIMSGTTVGDGSLTFMMFPSLTYNLTITGVPAAPWYISVSPRETEYTIHQPTANATSSYSNYVNTNITITEPNSSYMTFNAVYQDLSGTTMNVKYYVVYRPNNTIIYYRDMGNPGTSAITDNNVTLPNIRGVTYWAYFNKTTA